MGGCPSAAYPGKLRRPDGPSFLDVFREHGPAYAAANPLSPEQRRFLSDVQRCRTAALGGHLYACDCCGCECPVYNSCCNRHCIGCQALDQARWIKKRTKRILPVGHHHVVFTLPSELRPLARRFPRSTYGALFRAASRALSSLANERWNARLGVTAVLHTWTRKLNFHPHLHCIVTAGGLSLDDGHWVDQQNYLYPVSQLKYAYVKQVKIELQRLRDQGQLLLREERGAPGPGAWHRFLRTLPKWRRWVVHIEAPFGRSTHVLNYLGRYTHRVGISDARLISITPDTVTFRTRGEDRHSLTPLDFIQRFLQHVLPKGFHKIRHYGLYAGGAHVRLARARSVLGDGDREVEDQVGDECWADLLEELTGVDPLRCPHCEIGYLVYRGPIARKPRGPP